MKKIKLTEAQKYVIYTIAFLVSYFMTLILLTTFIPL